MVLSCADLHWNDLIANMSKRQSHKLRRQSISKEHVKSMSYFQKCEILNVNPVFLVRHFQHRVEVMFTEHLMGSDLLREIKY